MTSLIEELKVISRTSVMEYRDTAKNLRQVGDEQIDTVVDGFDGHPDGFYANQGDYETQANLNKNYRGNYKRLVELKVRYDPGNLFRLNANVQPSGRA